MARDQAAVAAAEAKHVDGFGSVRRGRVASAVQKRVGIESAAVEGEGVGAAAEKNRAPDRRARHRRHVRWVVIVPDRHAACGVRARAAAQRHHGAAASRHGDQACAGAARHCARHRNQDVLPVLADGLDSVRAARDRACGYFDSVAAGSAAGEDARAAHACDGAGCGDQHGTESREIRLDAPFAPAHIRCPDREAAGGGAAIGLDSVVGLPRNRPGCGDADGAQPHAAHPDPEAVPGRGSDMDVDIGAAGAAADEDRASGAAGDASRRGYPKGAGAVVLGPNPHGAAGNLRGADCQVASRRAVDGVDSVVDDSGDGAGGDDRKGSVSAVFGDNAEAAPARRSCGDGQIRARCAVVRADSRVQAAGGLRRHRHRQGAVPDIAGEHAIVEALDRSGGDCQVQPESAVVGVKPVPCGAAHSPRHRDGQVADAHIVGENPVVAARRCCRAHRQADAGLGVARADSRFKVAFGGPGQSYRQAARALVDGVDSVALGGDGSPRDREVGS